MEKLRNIATILAFLLAGEMIASMLGLAVQPASAQSSAERERCAESVGIQTRHNGRNSWIKRRVSGKTYNAFLRCTDDIAMKRADAKPGRP
ncbi:hypothetical protein SAMN04487843_104278 [Methylobacterium sp. ap11]|uniref:hypothetical protein n=1 Tax=Methylobacterium sp. ap11 TaxID=1761799 RepID=UPI0008C8FD37|nr:hypothetical protein [Methylobacterium sp. ap11]SEO86885.1 hypothetical protein SAMN04487843_104278 [Methylobacterium sp. ap11]